MNLSEAEAAPLISVVIPAFNCAEYLGRAIASVKAQTLLNYELIVVDDGSTDNTPDLLRRHEDDARVRAVRQENGGLPSARNCGARLARGRYVFFLDADDEIVPTALERVATTMGEASADWCLIDLMRVYDDRREIRRTQVPAGDPLEGILRDNFVILGMIFRVETLKSVGMYDETVRTIEDWDLNIRLLEKGIRFVHIPEPLYVYHWREGSIVSNRKKILPALEQVCRKNHKRLADGGFAAARPLYSEWMWHLARCYALEQQQYVEAARCLTESLRYGMGPERLIRVLARRLHRH